MLERAEDKMGIQTDAGELLLYVYKKYEEGDMLQSQEFEKESDWETNRLRNAVEYLKDKGMVKASFFLGGNFLIEKPYPSGIDIIENQPEFKKQFGFEVNLALIKFSWGVKEK